MLVDLSWPVALGIDVAAWVVLGVVIGWWFARRPDEAVKGTGLLLRLRGFEADGRWYERWIAVRRWKDRLPEAGTWFGGRSKRRVGRDRAAFAADCRRAEAVHWALLLATPAFVLWNPWWLFGAMVAYAVVANVPCLAALRYNRARLVRIDRRASRSRRP